MNRPRRPLPVRRVAGRHGLPALAVATALVVAFILALAACASLVHPPEAPALSVSSSVKRLNFSWHAVAGANRYVLFERHEVESDVHPVAETGGTTETVLDVAAHLHDWGSARYVVEACNAAGCTPSDAVSTEPHMLGAIGYVKASNTAGNGYFGYAVAVSGDGTTVAIGAVGDASSATGVDGDQSDDTAPYAGAVYVFRSGSDGWTQEAYLKPSNTAAFDQFGYALALSADGNLLAVGAPFEDSAASGVDGDQDDDSVPSAGAVYVFERQLGSWSQRSYLKASNPGQGDRFGSAVALSSDGSTLAVGAIGEDSAASGVDGDQDDDSVNSAGAVYVFAASPAGWIQEAYVKASNPRALDHFGGAVALDADGATMAVGATGEDSAATGVDGDQDDASASASGAAYVFARGPQGWSQEAYVKASNTAANDRFGTALALSANGDTLAVGATLEDSAASGVDGDQDDNSAESAGAVYVLTRDAGTWTHQAYVKASNTRAAQRFGSALGLSADGSMMAVGALGDASASSGVNGDQADDSATFAGAVHVLTHGGDGWAHRTYVKANYAGTYHEFGGALGLSDDGKVLAVGAAYEPGSATGIGGAPDDAMPQAGAAYLY
jgi:trimeric autotransporter adhesin